MLQPVFPLSRSDRDGMFMSHSELERSVKQNILFLLQTNPGEWPAKPELGVGIGRFLFENYSMDSMSGLKHAVKSQVKKYMPFIEIDLEFTEFDELGNSYIDNNYLKMTIRYNIIPLSVQEILNLKVTESVIEVI
jgi:phage baseplate assembly protein W